MDGDGDVEDEAEVAMKIRGIFFVGESKWIVDGRESMFAIILCWPFTCLTVK